MDAFEEHYMKGTQGSGKKIEWLLGEGQVEVVGNFKKGKKNLVLTVPQYTVLSILQGAEGMKLPVGEITKLAGLNRSRSNL